jgi:hypothetical protein
MNLVAPFAVSHDGLGQLLGHGHDALASTAPSPSSSRVISPWPARRWR